MKNIEQELKLKLDEREYRILSEVSNAKPQLQTNTYFGYDGMSRETMVRIRKKGDEYILCYKQRMSLSDGVSVCDERECEIAADYAATLFERGIRKDELKSFIGVEFDNDLRCLGSVDTYRTKFDINEWTLELDKSIYLGITDYEVECENRDVASLSKLKNYLYYTYGIVFKPSLPKVERFLSALSGK